MDYITTTGLRTQSSELVKSLLRGMETSLIYRSKIVGIIKPSSISKKFDVKAFKNAIKGLHLPKTTPEERDKIYRMHLMKKYGKGLS